MRSNSNGLCRKLRRNNPPVYTPCGSLPTAIEAYSGRVVGREILSKDPIVGHADVEMTEHYLHVQEEVRQRAIDRFSRAFAPKDDDPKEPDDSNCKVFQFPNVG